MNQFDKLAASPFPFPTRQKDLSQSNEKNGSLLILWKLVVPLFLSNPLAVALGASPTIQKLL